VDFLNRAVDIGAILGAEAVSFWAGVPLPGVDRGEAGQWLKAGVAQVLEHAERRGVVAALEPEPGMLVETLDDYALLQAHLPGLRLALDLGHCLVTQEREPPAAVGEFARHIGTVAIEDMRRGDHTHLPFGEGDMDIPACLGALEEIGFAGLVCVELSRESHRADRMIPQSLDWLRRCRQARAA
jgi:sugar phosphate isomerase/epimerase